MTWTLAWSDRRWILITKKSSPKISNLPTNISRSSPIFFEGVGTSDIELLKLVEIDDIFCIIIATFGDILVVALLLPPTPFSRKQCWYLWQNFHMMWAYICVSRQLLDFWYNMHSRSQISTFSSILKFCEHCTVPVYTAFHSTLFIYLFNHLRCTGNYR